MKLTIQEVPLGQIPKGISTRAFWMLISIEWCKIQMFCKEVRRIKGNFLDFKKFALKIMEDKKTNFLQESLLDQLRIINGVKFTHREIDIIAFLICGRAAKKIASFFLISPKTVENHTHNIMVKLGCNSREAIIDFIEKSDKLIILRKYYAALLIQAAFKKTLLEISRLIKGKEHSCILTYLEQKEGIPSLAENIRSCLKCTNINVEIIPHTSFESLNSLWTKAPVVFVTPKSLNGSNLDKNEMEWLEKYTNPVLFLSPGKQDPHKILKDFKNEIFYFLIFEIIKKLAPDYNLDTTLEDFNKQYEAAEQTITMKPSSSVLKENSGIKNDYKEKIWTSIKNKPWRSASLFGILGTLGGIYLEYNRTISSNHISPRSQNYGHDTNESLATFVRSDLVLPTRTLLLDRHELISKLDERFKGWKGIQSIALVGIGGAGKTILARRYASLQKDHCIWEINAETKQTLTSSFEDLAHALAKKEADQRMLAGILRLKKFPEREEKIIYFVKERLKMCASWFLIYDNVVKFSDIQKHFPKDPGSWGQGRILLTAQDNNLENNKYIHNVISINELEDNQKLNLFFKIINNGSSLSATDFQIKETKSFLAAIPSFPLDVSAAAYFLKATNTTYQDYIEKLKKYDYAFSNEQEKILEEAGDDYTKTRYRIITLSLKHLIETNAQFKDLLLFISLLDPQNIPKGLLLKAKNEATVNSFIRDLKKYSLIMNKNISSNNPNSVFTVHRSTQNIILQYLENTLKLKEEQSIAQSLVSILASEMSSALEREDFENMKLLSRHAERFLNQNNLLTETGQGFLNGELGCISYYLCHYDRAQHLLNLAISQLSKNPNRNEKKIAHFFVYLGNVHRRLGEYEKAKVLFEKSIALYEKIPEPTSGMARAYGYLGIVYESLGSFDNAKKLLEKSLLIHESCSQNQIGHAWSLSHLASVYNSIGDYSKAKELYEKSLQIYKMHSSDHVGVAWVCGNLGSIYVRLKNKSQAKVFFEESLTIYRKHFFEDHIYVAHALINLGTFYRENGDYEKAKNLLKKGFSVVEKTYGQEHAETGSVIKEIGKIYLAEGNLKGAEDMMNQTYHLFVKIKNPDQYEVLEYLAEIYQKRSLAVLNKGDLQKSKNLKYQAMFYLDKALKIVEAYFPIYSPHSERIQAKIKNENG